MTLAARIVHAELAIGDSVLMLADEFAEIDLLSLRTRGGPSQPLYLRVSEPDVVDATVRDAVEAGARLERAAADYDYGRNAVVVDPSGHRWMIFSSPAATPTPRHDDLAYLTHNVADTERARAFYGAVLGWTFHPGRIEDGSQNAGTYPPAGMHGGAAQAEIEPVYQVDDLTAALATIRDHGGQADELQEQPYGRIAEGTDNQGVHFQLLSRDRRRAPTRHSVGAPELTASSIVPRMAGSPGAERAVTGLRGGHLAANTSTPHTAG